MAPLPLERVTIAPPFTTIVTDFAGPFQTKCVGHRSIIKFESFLCIFVCLGIRAVHLEMTSGQQAEHFLQAFDRFKARRGIPKNIYSDNGPCFVKAKKAVQTDWEFGPPAGPHHQGLAEAAVKSCKRCLLKTTKNQVLTYEEYCTLFSRVEAVLNSRPICQSKGERLTPGHFLTNRKTKPIHWPLAKVIEVFNSSDNLVRKVKVRVHNEELVRSITSLVLLPVEKVSLEGTTKPSRGTV